MRIGETKSFVIFGIGRSGSTLLANLLNLHPLIHCDGEILRPGRWQNWRSPLLPLLKRRPWPYVYSRQLAVRCLKHKAVYGFKLHVQQVDDAKSLLSQLYISGWRIIHLERYSLFDQTISALVARHTHHFHGHQGQPEPDIAPFAIEKEQFLQMLRKREDRLQRCEDAVSAVPHLHLIYETDLASPAQWSETFSRICDYLGIPMTDSPLQPNTEKPWRRSYSELILNYGELQEAFRHNVERG